MFVIMIQILYKRSWKNNVQGLVQSSLVEIVIIRKYDINALSSLARWDNEKRTHDIFYSYSEKQFRYPRFFTGILNLCSQKQGTSLILHNKEL